MDGILIFAGLFSAVLTAFVVPKILDLKVNPADQSTYYQNQTVYMLDRISRQLAPTGYQISTDTTPPPYPTFHSSASDRRANICWNISLILSLSAAFLATLVKQWCMAYIRLLKQSSNPLKIARIRLFLIDGFKRLPVTAEIVPRLLHISLVLFFWGLGDVVLQIDTAVFVTTVIPIAVCVGFYLYCIIAPIRNPRSSFWTPFSAFIGYLAQNISRHPYYNYICGRGVRPVNMAARREILAMKAANNRMNRDVRGIQWLIDHISGGDETQALVLAIPGTFKQEWGRNVWKRVVRRDQSTSHGNLPAQPHPDLPLASMAERSTVYGVCRCVRSFFDSYINEGHFTNTKEGRRLMRGCVETVASLVCCTDVELGWFGEVEKVLSKVLSKVGGKERTDNTSTIVSNPLFTVHWTCLSLVTFWKIADANRLQESAKFALDGVARLWTGYGSPDPMALMAIADGIDDYLTRAWALVVDLHLVFEPWSENKTKSEVRGILNSREESISELERIAIAIETVVDHVDWRISFLQESMNDITHSLAQRLPGVSFLKSTGPIPLCEAFNFPTVGTTPVPPQLIFPGQQIQSLCTLGGRLRDIIEDQNTEGLEETLKSLESLSQISVTLHGLNYLMKNHLVKRQFCRLLDLRDGRGLGFTVELFFLAFRQLHSLSESSSPELTKVFCMGTFNVITSNWRESKNSAGTQRILLDLLCDLVIRDRGVFSNFSYPPYIVEMLMDLVRKMVEGHGGSHLHINEVIAELEDDDLPTRNRMNHSLRDQALIAIGSPSHTAPPGSLI